MTPPYCGQTLPWWPWFKKKLESTIPEVANTSSSFSFQTLCERKKYFFSIYSYVIHDPLPLWPYPSLGDHDFDQTWIWMLPQNFELFRPYWFWEQYFPIVFLCNIWSPIVAPTLPQGVDVSTNLNLRYLKMLSLKFKLFMPNVF